MLERGQEVGNPSLQGPRAGRCWQRGFSSRVRSGKATHLIRLL